VPDTAALPFHVLLVSDKVGADDVFGHALGALAVELQALGVIVATARSHQEGRDLVSSDPRICVVLVDVEIGADGDGDRDAVERAARIVSWVRERSDELPIFLMAEREHVDELPTEVVRESDGFVYLLDDTTDWIAGRLHDAAQRYRIALAPPMFGQLVLFARTHEYSWHTPGHEGGAAFRKSPVGRAFADFFGEQTLRSDLSISVGELGSLLDHSGPIGEAERRAAAIFGADFTFFVTNGGSTSNRVVHHGCVIAGDVVALDRNAHKSAEQSATMTHAVPVYMVPTRNRYGIIGPIPPSDMTAEAFAAKVSGSPFAEAGAQPVLAMVTNSTYDGLLYHVPTVDETLSSHIDRIHYDEAWFGHGAFNPLYHERHAMHSGKRPDDAPTTFATQSTHKLLAGLSQASYIHVRNGRNPVDPQRFNEAFMMHASTSPLYAIIASNDVAAHMMKGKAGIRLTGEALEEAIAFRKTLARASAESSGDWFFSCWQPDRVRDPGTGKDVAFVDAPRDLLSGSAEVWQLRESEPWHGFQGLPDGYAMLDPIKVTVLTPGIAEDGTLQSFGIPACIVSAYLDQHASIVVEKTQDYSILFLFSMGVTRGKWGSLVTSLFDFKRDFDRNLPLSDALPALVAAHPDRYGAIGLADLAKEMHETMRATSQMDRLHDAFSTLPGQALLPAEAYARVVRGAVEPVRLREMQQRTVAVGVVPYPPGIPLLMPGEQTGDDNGPWLGYLQALQDFDRRFPGFEHDTHGVESIDGEYVVLCVAT
jgi:lysine decarboxylase/arginine decarboxylase